MSQTEGADDIYPHVSLAGNDRLAGSLAPFTLKEIFRLLVVWAFIVRWEE